MMIKALTYVALIVTIAAGVVLLYRNQPYRISIERAGEVRKDQVSVVQQQGSPAAVPFGPVPNVPLPMPMAAHTPVPETMPTPALAIKRTAKPRTVKKKSGAATKLKLQWSAPEVKPFSLGDLFNVK